VNIKPGYKTTEFWMAVLTAIITMLFTAQAIDENTRDALFSMVAGLSVICVYIIGRAYVKGDASH